MSDHPFLSFQQQNVNISVMPHLLHFKCVPFCYKCEWFESLGVVLASYKWFIGGGLASSLGCYLIVPSDLDKTRLTKKEALGLNPQWYIYVQI